MACACYSLSPILRNPHNLYKKGSLRAFDCFTRTHPHPHSTLFTRLPDADFLCPAPNSA
jgi:hypothetical protein